MLSSRPIKQVAGVLMGFALCVSSTVASAATAPAPTLSPMVALSAFGTPASASAVRPVVHVPNAANLQMSAAAVQGDDEGGYSNLIPMLLVLGIIAGASVIVLTRNGNGDIHLPGMSPD